MQETADTTKTLVATRENKASGNAFSVILCLYAKKREMKVGVGELWEGGGSVYVFCVPLWVDITIYLLQGVLAYSCWAVRCTPHHNTTTRHLFAFCG